MPVVCRFFGITIYLYFRDHDPPHFHAKYGEYMITVDIETGVITGRFPKTALKLVLEWYELNKVSILENWKIAKEGNGPLFPIKPLD